MLHKPKQGDIAIGSDPGLKSKAALGQSRIQDPSILHPLVQKAERQPRKIDPL